MIAATGWTWDYIDEFLTLPRLHALQKHWRQYPPVHISAALFTGIKATGDVMHAAESSIDNAAIVAHTKADPRLLQWQSIRSHQGLM